MITEVREVRELDGDIIAYVDVLPCWSKDENRLREVIIFFPNKLRETGLTMNVDKTKVMIVNLKEKEKFRKRK